MPKVSVIIPTYGVPRYLEESIKSVLGQTLLDLELIVVDDNNPDTDGRKQTESLLERFLKEDDRICYLKHEHNKNGAVARNTGLAIAHGQYISFLDSDDMYLPTRLEECVAVMDASDDSIAGVYTGCEFRRGGKTYNTIENVQAGNFLLDTLAGTFMFCTGSNIFVRKSVIKELGGFDGSFLRHQDYEFLVRLFEKYRLAALPKALVVKNNDNVNAPKAERLISIKEQYLNKYAYLIDNLTPQERDYIYKSHWVFVAETAMKNRNVNLGKEYYKKAMAHGRLSHKDMIRRIAFDCRYLLGK